MPVYSKDTAEQYNMEEADLVHQLEDELDLAVRKYLDNRAKHQVEWKVEFNILYPVSTFLLVQKILLGMAQASIDALRDSFDKTMDSIKQESKKAG